MSENRIPWFGEKRFGWGWGLPQTWQGWVVLLMYFVFMANETINMQLAQKETLQSNIHYVLSVLIATSALILIAYLSSGNPKWGRGFK